MIPKASFAFEETLLGIARRGSLFFWTLTFREVMTDTRIGSAYRYFQDDIINLFYGNIAGVRVFEVHPGGHGLHVHFVVNRFIPKRLVDALSRKHGLGWTFVRPAKAEVVPYLSKYLRKTGPKLSPGVRRWAAFGTAHRYRVRDVIVETPEAAYVKDRIKRMGVRKLDFTDYLTVLQEARMTGFRSLDQWPMAEKVLDGSESLGDSQLELGTIPF